MRGMQSSLRERLTSFQIDSYIKFEWKSAGNLTLSTVLTMKNPFPGESAGINLSGVSSQPRPVSHPERLAGIADGLRRRIAF